MTNKNTEHTPGPWKNEVLWVEGPDGKMIARAPSRRYDTSEEFEARIGRNMTLISAAPELLEALEFVAKMLDDDGGRVQGVMYSNCLSPHSDDVTGLEYVKATIARAKGAKS